MEIAILKNMGALTAARMVTGVCGVVSSAYTARILGPGNFGVIALGGALLSYFGLLVALGMDIYGLREIARDPGSARRIVGNILGIRLCLLLVSLAAYLGIVRWMAPSPVAGTALAVLGLDLVSRALSLDFVFSGIQEMETIALRQVAVAVLGLAGLFAFVHHPGDLTLAAGVSVAASLASAALVIRVYARRFGSILPRLDRRLWQDIVRSSLPVALSGAMATIYYNLDMVLLSALRPGPEVGLYSAAFRLFLAATMPANIAYVAFMPALAATIAKPAEMRVRAEQFVTISMFCGVPIAAIGILHARDIVTLVYGAAFENAAPALSILMADALVVYVNSVLVNPLLAWNRTLAQLGAVSTGGVCNLVLNLLLIPRYGIGGAAAATMCSEIAILLVAAPLYRRILGSLHLKVFARFLGAGGVAVLVPWIGATMLGGAEAHGLAPLLGGGIATGVLFVALMMTIGGMSVRQVCAVLRRPSSAARASPPAACGRSTAQSGGARS